MNKPFRTYNGGKNGSGVYQNIINQIPPHEIFITGFAGNCGVLANKKRAVLANIAIDADAGVVNAWATIPGVTTINADSITFLPQLISCYPQQLASQIFVFLDPPYLKTVRTGSKAYYKNEMLTEDSHENLLRALTQISLLGCMVCLTHYPCKFYNDALKDWRQLDIVGQSRTGRRIERLYMNYPAPTALHDYSFIGSDFREREGYKKMQRNIAAKFKRMSDLERNFIIQSLT